MIATQADSARRQSLHGQWTSKLAFVLAVVGSAVGLGNVWRFPYMAGENGGGAFVLVYLLCVFGAGLPIMMAEILMGRRGRRNPIATMRLLGEEETGWRGWQWVGVMGVVAGALILSFYSVVGGWALAYLFKAIGGAFAGAGPERIRAIYGALVASPLVAGFWHTLFVGGTVFIVARGVERGLERAIRVMVPALFGLLLVLLGYAMVAGDFQQSVHFLFAPRFAELSGRGFLAALGQAFFTLSVGTGAVMAYGAYLPDEASIARSSVIVVVADTAIAVLAALVVFPIVFASGLSPAAGPGLVFESLPVAFGRMPGGTIIAVLFFLLLTFIAWTSAISLIEPSVAWFMERLRVGRRQAALTVGGVIWALGLLTVLSFGPWASLRILGGTLFENVDFLCNNVLLPIGGFAIVVFAGWAMARNSTADELDPQAGAAYRLWRFAARYVAPAAVILVLLSALGVLPRMLGAFESS